MITFALSNIHIMFMSSYNYNDTTSVIHHCILRNDSRITIDSDGGGYDKFTITGTVVEHEAKELSEMSIGVTEVHVLFLSHTNDGIFAHHFILKNNPYVITQSNYDVHMHLSVEGIVLKHSCKLWSSTSNDNEPMITRRLQGESTRLLLEMVNR